MDFGIYIKSTCLFVLLNACYVVGMDYEFVTCGSVVKLVNKAYGVRLHSHDIKYGSGSGQQSVTGMTDQTDANSYWQVIGAMKKECIRGTPIKCGQTIRLMHIKTNKYLHSHHFQAPMSRDQEVSAFGDEGKGDHLDNWVMLCDGKYWSRNEHVRFKHKETENYLSCSANTYGRPINGQQEVMCMSKPTASGNYWKAMEGIYIKPSEVMDKE